MRAVTAVIAAPVPRARRPVGALVRTFPGVRAARVDRRVRVQVGVQRTAVQVEMGVRVPARDRCGHHPTRQAQRRDQRAEKDNRERDAGTPHGPSLAESRRASSRFRVRLAQSRGCSSSV